uniref:RNA-dependent RNA polymerase n=1 Tax=Panagrolaimus superbus TaxID=310955 RepID=A0A914Z517_9BILA
MDPHEVLSSLDRLQKLIGKEIEFGDLSNNTFVKHRYYEKNFLKFPDTFPENLLKLNEQKYFPLVYAVEAIVSRGGSSYDYFFRKPYACFEPFLKLVSERYENDLEHEPNKKLTRTVRALELMLVKFDHILNIPEPIAFFTKCYEQLSEFESSSELIKTGFMRIRKVIVTPSRVLLCNPDIVPGNRCLRKYGDDNMIRVIFRDENLSKLYGVQKILIVKTVENFLKVPQWIGMRQFSYFCSSNSLLKDHGCYFVAGTQEDVKEFRIQCGNFKVESIPKMISQLGQCLTQSHKSSFELNSNDYCEVPDNVGGLDANGNPFIFSDGVGKVAKQIALDLGHPDYLPSCVEFRFRGYKGILSIDSSFDKTRTALLQNQRNNNNNTDESYHKKIMFRPSQKTFDAPKDNSFEIVKVSMPICVNLNKPLINILDQVTEKQDSVIHTKVKNRITSLLDRDILGIISTLIDPKSACLALKEFSKLIPYQLFDNFNITEEPFFRSLLFSSARIRLNRLIEKINIRIPSTHGRMMIGVFDESGILEPGQVFIRYTTDANLKFPSESSDKTTLVGSVMITKNSSIVPGDVRMFEAVDIELLHELIDVVVFSGKGDRPNSNEMSGANLDGDQFKVIWDSEFILHHNEKSFDYHSPSATEIPESFNDPNSDNTVSDLMIKTK